MLNQFSRTQLLYGKEAMDKLKNSRVAILGLGMKFHLMNMKEVFLENH